MSPRRTLSFLLITALMTAWCHQAHAGEDPASLIEALRERKLDGLTRAWALRELADPARPASVQAQLAVELAGSLLSEADQAASDEDRAKKLSQARGALDLVLKIDPEPAIRFHLLSERAWIDAWAGLRMVDRAEFDPHKRVDPEARKHLERAIAVWSEQLDRIAGEGGEPAVRQALDAIKRSMMMRLGFASLTLARISSGPEREDRLKVAISRLTPLAANPSAEPAALETLGFLMRALRLAGEFERAHRVLDQWLTLESDPAIRDAVGCERTETHLAERRHLDALKVIVGLRDRDPAFSPRREFLYLRVLLADFEQLADQPEKIAKLQASAFRQLKRLRAEEGGYWTRRAEQLASETTGRLVMGSAETMKETAELLARTCDPAGAAQAWRQAADTALAEKRPADAAAFLFEAGRAFERAGDSRAAAASFADLARQFPEDERADDSLLQAVINLRRAFRAAPQPGDENRLRQWLADFRRSFPKSEGLGEISFVEAGLDAAGNRHSKAIAGYRSVPLTHRLGRAARLEATLVEERWRQPLGRDAPLSAEGLAEAKGAIEELLKAVPTDAGGAAERAELTIRLARYELDERIDTPAPAAERLSALLGSADLPHEFTLPARRLVPAALTLVGKSLAAEAEAARQSTAPVEELILSLTLLDDVAGRRSTLERRTFAQVQQPLSAALEGKLENLTGELRNDAEQALALVELNRGTPRDLESAIRRLEAIKRARPRDPALREHLARGLTFSGRYLPALDEWRALVSGLPEETPRWYRAKLGLSTALRLSGRPDQAKGMLDVLGQLHPDFGGPAMARRFTAERRRTDEAR
jgi:tetratricopeptide (TPR) repeat protein